MTSPNGLPYAGALEAVKRIENALAERDASREETPARGLRRSDAMRCWPRPTPTRR
jgi:hypothetical protein